VALAFLFSAPPEQEEQKQSCPQPQLAPEQSHLPPSQQGILAVVWAGDGACRESGESRESVWRLLWENDV
jgi:hypothetical protein